MLHTHSTSAPRCGTARHIEVCVVRAERSRVVNCPSAPSEITNATCRVAHGRHTQAAMPFRNDPPRP